VPDADALRAATAQPRDPQVTAAVPAQTWSELAAAVAATWPAEAGPLAQWSVRADSTGATVRLAFLGQPLGAAAEALLSRALSEELGSAVAVVTVPYPSGTVSAPPARGSGWLPSFVRSVDLVRSSGTLFACVTLPRGADADVASTVQAEAGALGPGRVTLTEDSVWSTRLSLQPCAPPPADTVGAPAPP
jgi:hypothetical protein